MPKQTPLYYNELKNKINSHLNDPGASDAAKRIWKDIKKHMDGLKANAKDVKYLALGIYDKGDVVIAGSYANCFLDCTADLAFIRDLYGNPYDGGMYLDVWPRRQADFDIISIDDPKAWEICHAHNWLEWPEDGLEPNPLRFALSHGKIENPAVWDYLYKIFPETDLSDMFWNVQYLSAAKWLSQEPHIADKNYDGLTCPLKEAISMHRYRDTEKILEFLYGGKDNA